MYRCHMLSLQANQVCTGQSSDSERARDHWQRAAMTPHVNLSFSFESCVSKLSSQSMTAALQRLHWLPVAYRIRFKLLTLMHAAIHANTPRYLADRVSAYNPSRCLRSADQSLLVVPKVHSERFGRRAFSVAGPSLWNSLPLVLRTQKDDERFRRDLKTHLYKQAFM